MITEKDIQSFIWSQGDEWLSLVDPLELPGRYVFAEDLSDLTADKVLFNQMIDRLDELFKRLRAVNLFGIEVPLGRAGDSTTRVDLLGSTPGSPGLAIFEIKKSKHTEREAFTELLGYSQFFSALFPTLCREDLLLVLIAPMESRIVRDAYIQSLVFERKPIIVLQAVFSPEAPLDTVRLRPWIPDSSSLVKIAGAAFCPHNFNVCKVVWEESPETWNMSEGGAPAPFAKEHFNRLSALAAQVMEAEGIHGFCYASRLWPEIPFMFPNSLILVGWNPYSVRSTLNAAEAGVASSELHEWTESFPRLIPSLLDRSQDRHEDSSYLEDLRSVWDSHLLRIAQRVVELATMNLHGDSSITDVGFFLWQEYQEIMLEHVTYHNFEIRPTGVLRELFWDITTLDYEAAGRGISVHPDLYGEAIETLGSHYFLRSLIGRLFAEEADE